MENAGILLYGDAWQRALSRELGRFHPDGPRDSVDDRLVRRWASGQRDIPGWVHEALEVLLLDRQKRLEQLARQTATVRRMISEFRAI
jgi:hypothetical protein